MARPVVSCQATHQSRSRMVSIVQLIHMCTKAWSWRKVDFVRINAVYQYTQPFPLPSVVAFREISSTALMKLLLAFEIQATLCGVQATHRPTIVDLRLHCFLMKGTLLGGVWNSGAAPAVVHRGAGRRF